MTKSAPIRFFNNFSRQNVNDNQEIHESIDPRISPI